MKNKSGPRKWPINRRTSKGINLDKERVRRNSNTFNTWTITITYFSRYERHNFRAAKSLLKILRSHIKKIH